MKFAKLALPIMRETERKAMSKYFFRNNVPMPIDGQIDAVLEQMQEAGVLSADYPMLMHYLEQLTEMKTKTRQEPVSRDTIALIAGNLMGILLIVAYEQKHVMTSKGFSQIIRPKSN